MSGPRQRERQSFEPPPWEQDAFERLARERATCEPIPEEVVPEAAAPGLAPGPEGPAESEHAERTLNAPVGADAETGEPGGLSEAQLETMLLALRTEEPEARREYAGVVNAGAGFLLVVGLVLTIWATVLLASVGAEAGWLGATTSALMMVWGLMMIGGAVLLWRKYNLRS